jgi:hypothetical protein
MYLPTYAIPSLEIIYLPKIDEDIIGAPKMQNNFVNVFILPILPQQYWTLNNFAHFLYCIVITPPTIEIAIAKNGRKKHKPYSTQPQ